jgi:hypothetical protein
LGGVKSTGRFVEEQNLRIVQQGLGKAKALSEPSGKLGTKNMGMTGEGATLQELISSQAEFAGGEPSKFSDKIELFFYLKISIKNGLFRKIGKKLSDLLAILIRAESCNTHHTAIRGKKSAKHLQACGFSHPIMPEKSADAIWEHVEGEISEYIFLTQAFVNMKDVNHRPILNNSPPIGKTPLLRQDMAQISELRCSGEQEFFS